MKYGIWLVLVFFGLQAAAAWAAPAGTNLLVQENGAKVVAFSSEYGGWGADSMVPSLARLREPGIEIEDFVWCTADNAPFPHWVLFEFKQKQWLTTIVFNNALKEEDAYPGISARQVEVWVGQDSRDKLTKVAAFELERNKKGQSVKIAPVPARWVKFIITSNWGHPTWTEMNASALIDDGSRPSDFSSEMAAKGKVDVYGIYFDFASDRLRAESRKALEDILRFHKEHPTQALLLEGHTDNVGGQKSNQDLSMRRARAVIDELVRMGAVAARFTPVGFGAGQPVDSNDTEAGRAKNRRVTVRLGK